MSKKAGILYVISIIVLAVSITVYYTSSSAYFSHSKNQVTNQISNDSNVKKDKDIEFVGDYTLKKVENHKAYFMEDLPNYLPGRTGDRSVDIRCYRTSKFKEGVNFKLLRIYTEDGDNNSVHKYRFEETSK
ncbi:membrane protein [Staphylococcus phage CF5]|uniref:Membrane protein n=1 Tax=Staphylococcus phage CF5 TaxID=3113739 RepID=A0AAX4J7N7_9CAUD|nr:membrane protein [Staphylococcus phage CF5]